MKLCICLADASSKAENGTFDVLGLGVTRLHVGAFPTGYNGVLVLIATPEEGDVEGAEVEVALLMKTPDTDWQTIGAAKLVTMKPRDQAVATLKFGLPVEGAGTFTFRAVSGGVVAETHLVAQPRTSGGPEAS
ncbi:MAG: hypothetical protein JNK49_01155 [Planctomycetes bacterium]|nr:hypothetical protein [Planctomycetota bacterium]